MAVNDSAVGIENLRGALELGRQVLRSLELVNGGAVVAILTFYGNVVKDGAKAPIDVSWVRLALGAFGSGLVLAVVAGCLGYVGQVTVATSEPDEPMESQSAARHRARMTRTSQNFIFAAAVTALASAAAFAVGTFGAIGSFR